MEAELFVNIENFNGEKFQVIALENDNLDTLKLLIFAQNSIAISGCNFCINGQNIENSSTTLRELNLQNGDILQIKKRNSMTFNVPCNDSENDSSMEVSFFSEEQNNDYELPGEIQLNKGFSFAPTLKRQQFCGY